MASSVKAVLTATAKIASVVTATSSVAIGKFITVVYGAKSWGAHETGGASEATWAEFEAGGANPTTWADLET